jgi:uncharacterized membrane protein
MTEATPTGLSVGLAVTEAASALALAWVGCTAQNGTLPRNRYVGFRTRSTMATDGAWQAAHRAGGGALIVAALPQLAAAVVFAFRSPLIAVPFVSGSAVALMSAAVLVGTRRALRAAALYRDSAP